MVRIFNVNSTLNKIALFVFILVAITMLVALSWPTFSQKSSNNKANKLYDYMAKYMQLTLRDISVHGNKYITIDNIRSVIGCNEGDALPAIKIWHVKNNIEKKLSWAKKVAVVRSFPHSLKIYIQERIPTAIWRNSDGRSFIIDEDGATIIPYVDSEKFKDLILLNGYNANKYVGEIGKIISTDRKFAKNIASVTRVGDRRWTIKMTDNMEILLPENDYLDAWLRAIEIMINNESMSVKKIDLRVPGKVYFLTS